ncbi:LPS export ABC transporter permease LptF [Kaarinaea lacus]
MVIERYFAKEIFSNFTAVLTVVVLIFVVSYFTRYLSWAAEGVVAASIVVDLLLFRSVSVLYLIFPFALYISVLLAFGRLYKDSEMTALSASGVGVVRVMRAVSWVAFAIAIVVAAFSLYISPWAYNKTLQIKQKAEATSQVEGIFTGRFNQFDSDNDGVIYVEGASEDKKEFSRIFMHKKQEGVVDVVSARRAYQMTEKTTGARYMVFLDGYRYRGVPGTANLQIDYYEKCSIKILERDVEAKKDDRQATPTMALMDSTNPRDQAELHWRLSLPVLTLLFSYLAALMSRTSPRQGRFVKLFSAILLLVLFNNALSVARSWVERGEVSAGVGMWLVPAIMLIVVLILVVTQSNMRWLRDKWRGSIPKGITS